VSVSIEMTARFEKRLSGKITMRVAQPWIELPDDKEQEAIKRAKELMARLKVRSKQ
jgi:hypothetical protein